MELQNIFWRKPTNKVNRFNSLFNNNNMSGEEAL